jgi:hypothetical protein
LLEITLETDLARLTGQLAARWGNTQFTALTPYIPTVVAAYEHAASWRMWEMKPYLDLDGRPIDALRGAEYLGPHWTELYMEAVASLAQRDAYAALIASLHWDTLLERIRHAWPPGLESAMAEQRLLREHLVEALWEEGAYRLEADAAHLATNKAAMDALDTIATVLVAQSTTLEAHLVRAPLGPGRGDVDLRLTASGAGQVLIDPYPFEMEPLEVSWTVRGVPDRAYANQAEFLNEFYRAPLLHPSCTLVSGGS